MKLEDILCLNLSQIPNTPLAYTSQDIAGRYATAFKFTEVQFASQGRLLKQIEKASQNQLQLDILTGLSQNFFRGLQSLYDKNN